MKDQILKIAKVKSEKEFYKKYPTEEAFMKAHGKELKKAAMGKAMVYDQLHQLTDFGNPPIAQKGIGIGMTSKPQDFTKYFQNNPQFGLNPDGTVKQVGDAWNNASMAQYSAQQTPASMSAKFATPSSDKLLGVNDINAEADGGEGFDAMGAATAAVGALPGIIAGIDAIGSQRRAINKAYQARELSELNLQAQQTTEKAKRRYVRPEDMIIQPGQMGNPYGSGTNFLAKNGRMIGGNPTEIQNMYNPGDIYTDAGYEPIESQKLKQYRQGGDLPEAAFGDYFQSSGQAQIGSAVGTAAGSLIGGPLGGMIGGLLGTVGGNLLGGAKQARELEAEKKKAEMNTQQAAFAQAQQNQFGAYMEQGGKVDVGDEYKWVSHTWQPQTIAKFGEYNVKDLLKPPHDADMLRSGGHLKDEYYTPPSAEALFTGRPERKPLTMEDGGKFAMGGDLEVIEGGKAETISYNPFLPDGGETVMFKGRSHDNGGIPISFGENGVEVEGGEPAVKLRDGGNESNMVVFGNMKLSKMAADEFGIPDAKGKKFKHVAEEISKVEKKQNKLIDQATERADMTTGTSGFDQLKMNTSQAQLMGANMKLRSAAILKQNLGAVQNAILDTASELGVKSDELAQGKLVKEKDPRMMAQTGINVPYSGTPFLDAPQLYPGPTPRELVTSIVSDALKGVPPMQQYTQIPYQPEFGSSSELPDVTVTSDKLSSTANLSPISDDAPMSDKGKFDWKGLGQMALSNIAPFLRPRTRLPLDPEQLYPEYFAMATNQLEPVQAQTFQPMLDTPMDISLNDQLNAIDAQSRAAIRAAGQNPSAQAMIMSQSLDAKNKVLGEQTRINAANKMQTYDKNRAILNDAQLKNLQILDNQYVRQAQARSNTKAQTLEALKSIAAKTAQNKLENQTLNVYENMYNYRFSPSGVAFNTNLPAQFNVPGVGGSQNTTDAKGNNLLPIYNKKGKVTGYRVKEARNGAIVQALKNL
jgi:hypothetical protein